MRAMGGEQPPLSHPVSPFTYSPFQYSAVATSSLMVVLSTLAMTPIKVTGLGIADAPNTFVTRPLERVALEWGGIAGDRHFGLTMKSGGRQRRFPPGTEIRNARQLSILSEEELALIATELGVARVSWQWLGGNLCLAGHPALTQLKPSTRLVFPSGACLAIDSENLPCKGPGRIVEAHFAEPPDLAARFVKAALQRRGLVAWVERPGMIEVGNTVELVPS